MEKGALKNGCFFIRILTCTSTLVVCCLNLLPPSAGWDIIGYESDTFPSYRYLINCFYTIICLNYDLLLVTLPLVSRPVPTTA